MPRSRSKTLAWLKKGTSCVGILGFVAGVTWLWELRDVWPRAAGDPVPQTLIEAIAVVVGALFLVSVAR